MFENIEFIIHNFTQSISTYQNCIYHQLTSVTLHGVRFVCDL